MTRALIMSMAVLAAACTTAETPAPGGGDHAQERYEARGQEPGWHLLIHDGRIDYTGNYGKKKISVARPDPQADFNGLRYETPRLSVAVIYSRCNDVMSGFGFEHEVMVIADGESLKGCGGARKSEWDM